MKKFVQMLNGNRGLRIFIKFPAVLVKYPSMYKMAYMAVDPKRIPWSDVVEEEADTGVIYYDCTKVQYKLEAQNAYVLFNVADWNTIQPFSYVQEGHDWNDLKTMLLNREFADDCKPLEAIIEMSKIINDRLELAYTKICSSEKPMSDFFMQLQNAQKRYALTKQYRDITALAAIRTKTKYGIATKHFSDEPLTVEEESELDRLCQAQGPDALQTFKFYYKAWEACHPRYQVKQYQWEEDKTRMVYAMQRRYMVDTPNCYKRFMIHVLQQTEEWCYENNTAFGELYEAYDLITGHNVQIPSSLYKDVVTAQVAGNYVNKTFDELEVQAQLIGYGEWEPERYYIPPTKQQDFMGYEPAAQTDYEIDSSESDSDEDDDWWTEEAEEAEEFTMEDAMEMGLYEENC